MTLVELMVVVMIATLLLAVGVPMMKPAIDENKVREASREVTVFLEAAKARAMELGRPVGVYLQPSAQEPYAVPILFVAETPPAYVGDVLYAKAFPDGTNPKRINFTDGRSVTLEKFVQAGDVIRFGYKGEYSKIASVVPASGGVPNYLVLNNNAPALPGGGIPYQILRRPRKSAISTLQLPRSVVIDLQQSGMGFDGTELKNATGAPMLMFSKEGTLDSILDDVSGMTPTGTIHLLLGRFDQVGTGTNLSDPRNVWVSIGRRNGTITSSENGWVDDGSNNTLRSAREFAQQSLVLGGR